MLVPSLQFEHDRYCPDIIATPPTLRRTPDAMNVTFFRHFYLCYGDPLISTVNSPPPENAGPVLVLKWLTLFDFSFFRFSCFFFVGLGFPTRTVGEYLFRRQR